MVFTKSKGFLLVIIALLLVSCSKPKQQLARERFIVTSNNLNIRIDPTQLSKTIGTLSKGDTIIALASDKFWVMVKVENQTGFIASEYLKKLAPIKPPKFISFIEKYTNPNNHYFWLSTLFLLSAWILLELRLIKYEKDLKEKHQINTKKISVTPLIFFASAILTAILYLLWRDQVIDSLFYKFSLLPKGMGSIAWIIWIQFATITIGLIIDLIGSIYLSGVKYGFTIYLFEQGINLIIFATALFLTLTLFVVAIIILVIFFAILYTFIVTENGKSFPRFINSKI
ncbi:MAG: SH3 domain-containing protein [Bacteroidales bacterium]|nr:MAG: SH3 domain-containing protein [Bacteroidales bacterium]